MSADAPELTRRRDALDKRVLVEQVALMCRLTTSPLFGSTYLGLMFCWLMYEDYGLAATLIWYATLMLVTLVRWRTARAYLAQQHHEHDVQRWRSIMLTLAAIAGLVWSIPGSFMLPTDREKEIVTTILLIGATASGVGSQAPVRHAYACLLVPFVIPYSIVQLMMGGERIISGIAMLTYIPVVLVIANRQTDAIDRQIRLTMENEALVDELRRERDRTNLTNIELQAHVDQLRRSTEHIASLNHDLETQAGELRRANSDLEGFSYSVSHDLRAPLRAIHGFATLLTERLEVTSDKDSLHFLRRIRENVQRMSTLIDDLLAFSKCGRQPVDMQRLDMEALASVAANEALASHEMRGVPDLVIEHLPNAWGDAPLMLQVWRNLLDNAVKYSSKVSAPRIVVSGRDDGQRLVFEVTDNGIGFDSQYSEALFGVFQRLHRISDYPGSGVGLAIVQRIVARHDGEVWAQSQPNQGSTFSFALPRVRSDERERQEDLAANDAQ